MPYSWHFPTGLILDTVARLEPTSIVDIGVGYGKWGLLLREQLDWVKGRLARADWETRIDGIEVFPYESPLHDWVYDSITWGDVVELAPTITGYDLVLMSDVIAHLDKDAGRDLLLRLVGANKNVIVSSPMDFFHQAIGDNEHEHHVSHWTIDDFAEFNFDYDVANGAAFVVTIAGVGASYPKPSAGRASRVLYGVPGLGRRGSVVHLLKQLLPGR